MSQSNQPLKVYGAPRMRALRVVWLLEELGLPYDLELVQFRPTGSEFFIQATPTGKIPTLVHGDLTISESGAIIEYVLEHFGQGRLAPSPSDADHGRYLQWLHFAESTAFPPLGVVVWLTRYRTDAAEHPVLLQDAISRAKQTLSYVDVHLQKNTYMVGTSFTAADIMMGFTLLAANDVLADYNPPASAEYLQRIMNRASAKKALALLAGGTT